MRFHDVSDDSQPQTHAFWAFPYGFRGTEKIIEDLFLVFGGDTDSIILDLNLYIALIIDKANEYFPSILRILYSIVQEISQSLLDGIPVDVLSDKF